MDIVRSETLGCFKPCLLPDWGVYCKKVKDPLADVTDSDVKGFEVAPTFTKIPSLLWETIVSLYFEYVTLYDSEVTVILFQNRTRDKWKCCIPLQGVTGASAKANFKYLIDIETGEEILYPEQWNDDWIHVGSSHSHGTMRLDTFSGTDDGSELVIPGIHILVSTINTFKSTYKVTASMVQNYTRYYIDEDLVIELPKGKKEERSSLNNKFKNSFNNPSNRLLYRLSRKMDFSVRIKDYIKYIPVQGKIKSKSSTMNYYDFPTFESNESLPKLSSQPKDYSKLEVAFQEAIDSGMTLSDIEEILYSMNNIEDLLFFDI